MATIEDFAELVRPQIKGVSEPAIEAAVIRSARNFCAQSWFVRRILPVSLQPEVPTYLLVIDPDAQLDIVGVRAADLKPSDNHSTSPFSGPDFSGLTPDVESTYPRSLVFLPYNQLTVRPTPQQPVVIPVEIAVQPTRQATQLPDELVGEYADTIAAGALEILFGQRGRDWFDINESMRQGRVFSAGRDNAKALSLRNYTRANLRARQQAFLA